jgi:3-phenylpropionate/cinnamic acid dioxygenase small subunit
MEALDGSASLNEADAARFLYREARLLDAWDFRAWQQLLTDDVVYWVPLNATDTDPQDHLAIVYDDRQRLETRIWRLCESGFNHSQEPRAATVRYLTNIECDAGDDAEFVVRCNLLLHEYRSGAQRRDVVPAAYSAHCEYRLRAEDGTWKIAFKKVALLAMNAPLPPLTFIL